MKKIEISVIVLTYFPKWTELKKTLLSIIHQEGINYEIIIADDGSDDYCIDKIKELFQKHNFENYEVVHQEKNVGTCKNCLAAIKIAKGEYVRLISPGDFISQANSLREWYQFMDSNNINVSFGILYLLNISSINLTSILDANTFCAYPYKYTPNGIFNLLNSLKFLLNLLS